MNPSSQPAFTPPTRRSVLRACLVAAMATLVRACKSGDPLAAVGDLRAQIQGTVIVREEAAYETWRRAMIWQYSKAPRRPQLIVQADNVDDVIATVNFARQQGLRLTTRCGGHSMSACFLRNDGILLDVSRLDGVSIARDAKRVVAGPGVIGSGLNRLLRAKGLVFSTAGCGTVPISGFLLGGGIGVNVRGWAGGRSAYAIEAVDIVTADGVLRKASRTENPDLFWAVQGGGPGLFGVVTRFTLNCVEAPAILLSSSYRFRLSDLGEILKAVNDLSPDIDRNVECAIGVVADPQSESGGSSPPQFVVNLDYIAYAADEQKAEALLAPVGNHPVLAKAVRRSERQPITLDDYYGGGEIGFPQSHFLADNFFTNAPVETAGVVEGLMPEMAGNTKILFVHMGDDPLQDAACSTTGRFYLATYHRWSEAREEAGNRENARKLSQALKPLSNGSYINEMDQEGRSGDIPSCYSPKAWNRLRQLREIWDPSRVFQNFYGQT